MKKRDFSPINRFKHERVQKLKLRHSGGGDHVSNITIANRLIDDVGSISGRSLAEFLFRVENFYLHLLTSSLLKTLPLTGCCRSFNRIEYALILHAIFEVRAR